MLTIDGSRGEGGGQILRTALALAMVTGSPFRIENIRAGRAKPGLLRQHLTAVNAAAAVSGAAVDGATAGSRELVFRPGSVKAGDYRFAVGTAGSTGLVLQTVLPALLTASGPSTVIIEGGTHNPAAPPFDFLARAFFPLVERMGPRIDTRLERAGFYPAGGGQCSVTITPAERLRPFTVLERGAVLRRRARAVVARLSPRIAQRELRVVRHRLGWNEDETETVVLDGDARGPGNVLLLELESEHVTEVFTGFGEVGVTAEAVADRVAHRASLSRGRGAGRTIPGGSAADPDGAGARWRVSDAGALVARVDEHGRHRRVPRRRVRDVGRSRRCDGSRRRGGVSNRSLHRPPPVGAHIGLPISDFRRSQGGGSAGLLTPSRAPRAPTVPVRVTFASPPRAR